MRGLSVDIVNNVIFWKITLCIFLALTTHHVIEMVSGVELKTAVPKITTQCSAECKKEEKLGKPTGYGLRMPMNC